MTEYPARGAVQPRMTMDEVAELEALARRARLAISAIFRRSPIDLAEDYRDMDRRWLREF